MAGAGYKLFNTGDVLTAAQVNTYLQEQAVMRFANSTARTTALSGVLAEGMVSYLDDTNAVEVYNGSAWVGVSGTGDVTEVQAGTGISVASGTGPIPVVTNSMATTIDAKGDLIVGTGSDTFARLPVGTNDYVLTAASGETTGLKWVAAAGGGKVLQVVQGEYATETSSSSSTYADTGLTASITPSSASSKILIIVNQNGCTKVNDTRLNLRLLRGATELKVFGKNSMATATSLTIQGLAFGIAYLDSPSTTSSTTYKTQFASDGNAATVRVQQDSIVSTITLLEIGA